ARVHHPRGDPALLRGAALRAGRGVALGGPVRRPRPAVRRPSHAGPVVRGRHGRLPGDGEVAVLGGGDPGRQRAGGAPGGRAGPHGELHPAGPGGGDVRLLLAGGEDRGDRGADDLRRGIDGDRRERAGGDPRGGRDVRRRARAHGPGGRRGTCPGGGGRLRADRGDAPRGTLAPDPDRSGGLALLAGLALELLGPRLEPLAQLLELLLPELLGDLEHLLLFFLLVVLDQLVQDGHLRVEALVL